MEKIKSISEAYNQDAKYWGVWDKDSPHFNPQYHCKEIKLENIRSGTGEYGYIEMNYYVGYDHEGRKIFQYLADSVNVEFDTEVENGE